CKSAASYSFKCLEALGAHARPLLVYGEAQAGCTHRLAHSKRRHTFVSSPLLRTPSQHPAHQSSVPPSSLRWRDAFLDLRVSSHELTAPTLCVLSEQHHDSVLCTARRLVREAVHRKVRCRMRARCFAPVRKRRPPFDAERDSLIPRRLAVFNENVDEITVLEEGTADESQRRGVAAFLRRSFRCPPRRSSRLHLSSGRRAIRT
ncbi:unnamed protein product, partial [Rangifer tarandus platyrhynchus]